MANNGAAGAQGTSRNSNRKAPNQATQTNTQIQQSQGQPQTNVNASAAVENSFRGAQTDAMSKGKRMLMDDKRIQCLNRNIGMLNSFINHSYMADLRSCRVLPMDAIPSDRSSIHMYELTNLMLSETEDTYEKLVSLYTSLNLMEASVGIILDSDGSMVHIYLCTCSNDNGVTANLLYSSVKGHFPGSMLSALSGANVEAFMRRIQSAPTGNSDKYIKSVSVIPSRRNEEKENRDLKLSAQGIEKFIDGMIGKKYTVLFLAEPLRAEIIDQCKQGFESLYTLLSPFSKETVSYGENESDATNYSLSINMSETISNGISNSYGTSHSTGQSGGRGGNSGTSFSGDGFGFNSGSCWNSGWNTSDSTSQNVTDTSSVGTAKGSGEQSGDTHTIGLSRTINITRDIKTVLNCMQRLDAEIQRIETNRSFGMWNCCCYVVADDLEVSSVAASSLQSLLCGDAPYGVKSYVNVWSCNASKDDAKNLLCNLSYMQHPRLEYNPDPLSSVKTQTITPSMMVSGRDLPTLLSLPRRSVPGLQVRTMAEFGRNFPRDFNPQRRMEFGNIMHMGVEENTKIAFNVDSFAAHCFICGASGSGKSNTTYNLLEEFHKRKIPFLVIEPAKGEYKIEFGNMTNDRGEPDIQIFTCKPDSFRMLSLNPFEFHKDVHIKEHLAHLNSVVSTCWPLYGPMPAMLKDAFEEAYISCGWDLELSERIVKVGKEFPTFAEVLPAIERIIDGSTYSGESKGDYKGALCMRIKMLMNGFEGQIFGSPRGIPDAELFNANAVVDLSSIGNPETRSLIMGLLIIKLREYRYATQRDTNSQLKHITVLEEAHNILKRCSHESSQDSGNVQGASVGMLVDCIAEMRSCGEGFMIIDQSPGAVDEAALKNTAIKIVMRLPEKKDCEAVGNTLSLTEEQMAELSKFDRGVAAVFHEGWDETVLGKMGKVWKNTPEAKRYRANILPVNRIDLLRAKGAICQWLCAKYKDDELDELENMNAIDSFIRAFKSSNYAASINENIWKDIRQQLNMFFAEIKDNIGDELGDLGSDDAMRFMEYFGVFMRRFLQIDGIFKLVPLDMPNYDPLNIFTPTPKDISIINSWWERIRDIVSNYVLMPVKYGGKPLQWTSNTFDGQYMRTAFGLMLYTYANEYENSHSGMSSYSCAYWTLDKAPLREPKTK